MAKRSGKATIKFLDGREVESTPETQAEALKEMTKIQKKREADEKAANKKTAGKASTKEA